MEDKIEVGEYVRTKRGKFGICINISNITGRYCQPKYLIQWSKSEAYYITKQTIVKHSKNIIDLIEEGDYVNGYLVQEIQDSEIKKYRKEHNLTLLECFYENFGFETYLDNIDIKSIVTYEQFSSIEYKITKED